MEHNFEICKTLSKKVYDDNMSENIDGWQMLKFEGQGTVTNEQKKVNVFKELNFACAAYRKDNEIIIAFRGTNDKADVITDLNFVFKEIPLVTPKFAREFYDKLKKMCADCKFYFTGHSLGGAYAQLLCAQLVKENDIDKAITFNAPGMAYALDDKNASKDLKYPNISNYVVMNDFVGNFKAHIGETYYIQPFPLDRKNEDGTIETSHGCILSYDEATFGAYFSKPIGFGTKEAWALYCYDVKNSEPYKVILKRSIRPQNLENAINIIKDPQNNIKLLNDFKYKTGKQEYELTKTV
jgi:hypothetical protein